jgi:hypothetical protein
MIWLLAGSWVFCGPPWVGVGSLTDPASILCAAADGGPPSTLLPPAMAVAATLPKSRSSTSSAAAPLKQPGDEEGDGAIRKLYADKKLFNREEYPPLRRIFAQRLERAHGTEMRRGFADEAEKMTAWLNSHADLKEELLTAVDPNSDNVAEVFALLRQLVDKFPKEVNDYGELAIATAVVWDQERAVYDHRHHQRRAKALLPEGQLDALENFQYLVASDRVLQRVRFLPWEFLVHVVNHKTPLGERQWAVAKYLPSRVMIGRCYKDVPYDDAMLDSNSTTARLNGKPYTLESIRSFGGVCALQADFASRVAKSLAVPAAYVGGEAKSGEMHAWVMWVELKGLSKDNISFSLESFGRYRGDKYYVGVLTDPQTGQRITDRQLELRLHTVGVNPPAKRQAALIVQALPMLREKVPLGAKEELAFLGKVIRLSPGNEEAWRAVASLSKEKRIDKQQVKAMMQMVDKLFVTFAMFPDFTWEVFDDLITFQNDSKQRPLLYGRLVQLYEQAARPDLACEARLKYADYLIAEARHKEAVEGLALTIKRFPDEGRYVPKMLDKLEKACRSVDDSAGHLVRFYQQFLPLVPPLRDDRVSPYCVEIYHRAIQVFQQNGRKDLAALCEARLAQIQAAGRQSKEPSKGR